MEYLSVKDIAKLWGVSERTVRHYCQNGKVKGAFLTGKTWNIPVGSVKPIKEKVSISNNDLLNILMQEKSSKLKGGIYHKTQVNLTFNSNHIEGSRLTEEQTRYIYETNTIGVQDNAVNIDDIIETTNHFRCVNFIIDNATKPLSVKMIKELHFLLKIGTSDSSKDWFNVGDYKKLPNEIGGKSTTSPKNVKVEMENLINKYNVIKDKTFEDILSFHVAFESIHPFQDGNGRIGRLIMFKECLANNIVPFIITSDLKYFYYRGLQEWKNEKGFLLDTCLSAQDEYKRYLDYFEIKY